MAMGYFYSKFICNTGLAEKYGREGNGGDDHDCYVLGTEVTLRRTIGEGSEATWHGIAVSAGRRRTGPS